MAKPVRGTVHSIQLLRGIAAMLVALFHAQQAFATRLSEPAFALESYLFAFGAVGVHIFFVISGFIMVYTSRFEGGFDARGFLRRRIMRIYPIYWLCIAIYVVAHWLMGTPYALSVGKVIGALLLLPGDAAAIIGPAWTLCFEMFFYLCFGLAMMAGLNRGLLLLGGCFLGFIAIGLVVPIDNAVWDLITNALLVEFLAGAAIGWLFVKGYMPGRGGMMMIAASIALFAAGIAYGYDRVPSVVIWGVPSALLIAGVIMCEAAGPMPQWVQRLGYFGDSSYALYLIHIIIITIIIALAPAMPFLKSIEPALAALPVALIALIIAEVLHHGMEKPLLRRLNPKRIPVAAGV